MESNISLIGLVFPDLPVHIPVSFSLSRVYKGKGNICLA